ncbi:hypothetical protein GCM10009801_21040 [Streptomyces albiaxialis]|uniref:HNH domain-containing protein n=1 Tax=Streptomyces albiaxialis TaxID=329523 RepID=A0ABN2VRJ8_9ACTN
MRSPNWSRDELLLACALVVANDWKELRENDPRVQDLSDLLRSLPLHGEARHKAPNFRSVGSVSHKTTDLASNHPEYAGSPTKGGKLDHQVIADFVARPDEMLEAASALRNGVDSGELYLVPEQPDETDEDSHSAPEGRLLTRWALYRERSPVLRRKKITQAQRRGQPLQCTVCSFDFARVYGGLGAGFIEVHHVLPLHQAGPRETRLDDLAFLCANCHRMCHRTHDGMTWRTPSELRELLASAPAHS